MKTRGKRRVRALLSGTVGAFALIATPMADVAAAQDRPGPVAELAAGWVGFADDGVVSESLVGGAARFYLSPRISVGPEIAYISGSHHSHLMLTGNVTGDLLPPANGRPRRVAPFLVAGAGLFQTRESFVSGPFTSNEGAFTAGGGVRALVGDRVTLESTRESAGSFTFVSPDTWECSCRVSVRDEPPRAAAASRI